MCETGDCQTNSLQCFNKDGVYRDATLAEFALATAFQGQDFYDISNVDAYNLPISMKPKNPSSPNKLWCTSTGCNIPNLSSWCNPALRKKNSAGQVVSCLNSCVKFGTDSYCCQNFFNNPSICKQSSYAAAFKAACPNAYSFPYDDANGVMFSCKNTGYDITFC